MSLRRKRPVRSKVDLDQLPEEERVVAQATAYALGEHKVRWNDSRLLIIFLFVVIWVVLSSAQQSRNCSSVQGAFNLVNRYFDQQAATTAKRTDISPAVKKQILANFERNRLHSLNCSLVPLP